MVYIGRENRSVLKKYKNKSRISGVAGYEIGNDYIKIKFIGGDDAYVYSYTSAGETNVEIMKSLAQKGIGLSTYISLHVRNDFEKRG